MLQAWSEVFEMGKVHEPPRVHGQVAEPCWNVTCTPSAQEVANYTFVPAGKDKWNHLKVVGREDGRVCWNGIEPAVAYAKASEQ